MYKSRSPWQITPQYELRNICKQSLHGDEFSWVQKVGLPLRSRSQICQNMSFCFIFYGLLTFFATRLCILMNQSWEHYYYYWLLLYSTIFRSRADSLRSHVILHEWPALYSAFLNSHRSGALKRWHGWCHMKLMPSRRKFCVYHTSMHLTYVALHEVTWWMIVRCTQNLCRDGSSFMWHQPCQRLSTPLRWI